MFTSVIACTLAPDVCAQPPIRPPLSREARPTRSVFAHVDIEKAWADVKASNRPLLLFVSMNECFFCDKMERETYSHPELAKSIRSMFVTAKMMKEADPDLVEKMGVRAYPTTLIISPEGDLIARIEGFVDPKKFVTTVRPAVAKHQQAQDRTATSHSGPAARPRPRQ